MSIVNMEKVINGTPEKVLLNGYNKMKENYTEASAQEYYQTYSNESLSFLLENSRLIFSEPYFGCNYYREAVLNNAKCRFTALEKEQEKIKEFLYENGSNMDSSQRAIYKALESDISSLLDNTKNTRIYANYIKENIDDTFEEKLSNAVFSNNENEIKELFESTDNPIVFFTYAPYAVKESGTTILNSLTNKFFENSSIPESYNENKWTSFVESTICGNKLSMDDNYINAVNSITNRDTRFMFEYFMNTNLTNIIDQLTEEKVKVSDVVSESTVSAINNIFDDMFESCIGFNTEDSTEIDVYKGIVYESTLNILISEYQTCDDVNADAYGYSIINESMSIDNAFKYINELYTESVGYISESDEEDVSDDDIDKMNNDVEDRDGGIDSGKKPKAPKPKNLANRIQFHAMDKEAKWQKKRAISRQKGQERLNVAKAVAAIPQNVVNDIKLQCKKIDEMDDEKRKAFMTEPGFRKKAFKNLRLAILYGTAAHTKLSLVPVVAIIRHFSKKKDVRIRNELIRELETELSVTEEKIQDANAQEDKKEKYRLMRIRDRLKAEIVRVKTNSKYV